MKKKIALVIGYGQSNRDGVRSLKPPGIIARVLTWLKARISGNW